MNYIALTSLFAGFLSIGLGAYVFSKDTRSKLHRVLLLLAFVIAWSAVAEFGYRQAPDFESALTWTRLAASWPLVFPVMIHFIFILTDTDRRLHNRPFLIALYASGIFFAFIDVSTSELAAAPQLQSWGWSRESPEDMTALRIASGVWVLAMTMLGLYLLARSYLTTNEHRRKQQAKYALIGTSLPVVSFALVVVILPLYDVNVPSPALLAYSVGLLFFVYGIWRHQLFSLTVAVVANEMLSTISDSLILITAEGKIGEVNRATLDMTGYRRDELVDQPIETILPDYANGDSAVTITHLHECLTLGTAKDVETTFKTNSGRLVPISLSISVLRASDGEQLGLVCVGRDLTERKWAEEELRKANDVLEDRVRERTVELTATSETLKAEIAERKRLEQQLVQSQKLEALGTLAGGVAHDFNNILSAIMGFSYLGQIDSASEDVLRGYFVDIHKSSERAASLTRQLLAFSRRQIAQPEVFDLNALVLDLYKMLARLIGEGIELVSMARDSKPVHIEADPGQIEQVLVNLVVNARDALPNGGRILINTALVTVDEANSAESPEIAPGEYVRLIVSDNGVGMTDDIKDKIFDPFFTTKEVGRGTGLGLSTCYGIIAQNDGFIHVDTTLGVGTSFYVYLPLAQHAPVEVVIQEGNMLPKGTETVLVVEDEETVRDTAATILRDRGYEVIQASNGRDALRVLEDSNGVPIDVVVTDVVMPVMGGRELAEQLYRAHPETKIVFMSGYSGDPIDDSAEQQPLSDLIEKPFTAEALTRKVREVLDAG